MHRLTFFWLSCTATIVAIILLCQISPSEGAKNPANLNSNANNNNNNGNGNNNNNNRVAGLRNLRRSHRSKFPLKPIDGNRRKSKRAGECRLGKNVHEIGDTWNPDLGEPFGTMYCIECSCEANQRKRRIVGRVRCRNIRNSCPKVECPDAITLPGQCCKSCPELFQNTDNQTSDGLSTDDNDITENNREYAALLTPRSSSEIQSSSGLGEPLTYGLASGRFMFLRRSLYYSFVYNDALPRPKYIQFVDIEGNVVEEQEVTINNYQQQTRKICGVWSKMARVYRKLLKEEKLFAALVTEKINGDNDRFLAGRVAKQKHASTELYSSLLEPSTQTGTGGLAIISISASTGSIFLNIIFNGDFNEERDIGITVRVADASGTGVEESVQLNKIQYDTNTIEVKTILEVDQLKSLSRGTLFIVVYSKKNPDFKLIGFIQARTTCDIFDTILSSEESRSIHSGLGWVYPLPDGSWSYNIQLPLEHEPLSVKIETGRKVLEELPITPVKNLTTEVVSGMSSRYFQLLYEENIYLSVITNKGTLRGKLTYRGFGDAQLSDAPLLFEPGQMPDLKVQGLVWLGIDSSCGLNYQLMLSERPQSELMRLEVVEMPGLELAGIPVQSYVLDDFETSEYDGEFHDLQKGTFVHINAGDALFKVVRVNDSSILASTVINNIRVPNNCLPARFSGLPVDPFIIEPEDDVAVTPTPSKCFYDGKLRDEYSQWVPANDTCQVCNCYKGRVKCDTVVCPAVDCPNPVLLTGECCRTCLGTQQTNLGRGCDVKGDRFHPAGSKWHPYLPPDGFMVCTTCTCNANTLTAECVKETCPTLKCASEVAVYPSPLACCKVCPVVKESENQMDDVYVVEVQKGPTEAQILAAGGCKFRGELHTNGEEWNHRIEPFGYTPCIICSCRNGESKCGRKKCPQLSCHVKIKDEGECCARCSNSSSSKSSEELSSQQVQSAYITAEGGSPIIGHKSPPLKVKKQSLSKQARLQQHQQQHLQRY